MTASQRLQIEKDTRQQANSVTWLSERRWRLTASRFGEIIKQTIRRNQTALCESLYGNQSFSSNAIVHGKTYESVAIEKFKSIKKIEVDPCGLFILSKESYLAGSPDGRCFHDNKTCLIECKCPFNGREEIIRPGKNFAFLELDENGVMKLKKNSNYYYQVQGLVSGMHTIIFTNFYICIG